MNNSCLKFLESQVKKGGQNAYVAMLILAAVEKNEKELLKRANLSFIQSNFQDKSSKNQAS